MENRRAVLISAGVAGLAVLLCWMFMLKYVDMQIGDQKQKVYVVKATRPIPANVRIDESMIVGELFPAKYAPPEVAGRLEEVVGQVAIATIAAGEPILKTKIIPFDESALDRRIPDGMRAVTVGIRDDQDVVGVGGMIRPGHFVDVLLTLFVNTVEIEKGGAAAAILGAQDTSRLRAETRTIFQNVRILAVGRDARLATARVNRLEDPSQEELTNKNVTVALKPDEVQRMVLAQATGRLTLALRRFNDTEIVAMEYLDPFRAFGIRLPIVSGPPPAYREIRGGQVFAVPQ